MAWLIDFTKNPLVPAGDQIIANVVSMKAIVCCQKATVGLRGNRECRVFAVCRLSNL